MRLIPLLLVVVLSGCAARTLRFIGYRFTGKAPAKVVCRADGPAKWCLHEPPGQASRDVVYFLHYATGDEESWDRLGLARVFYGEFAKLGRPAPRVVTISYGPHWVVTQTPGLRQFVLVSDFKALRERIEKTLGAVDRRSIWGMSQGGYNAAEIVLSDPGDWTAAALSCPAIYAADPYFSPAVEKYPRGEEGRHLLTWRLAGEKAYLADNPLALAGQARRPPPFWIEADTEDEFGFIDGAVAFDEALRQAGGRVTLVKTVGQHCFIDARAASRFLAGFAEESSRQGR